MDEALRIEVAGENALMVYLGNSMSPAVAERVRRFTGRLRDELAEWILDTVPSYASVLVIYRPGKISPAEMQTRIAQCGQAVDGATALAKGRLVKLPVWYGTEAGADLAAVAEAAGLSTEEVVARHHGKEYHVYAIGFAPGAKTIT